MISITGSLLALGVSLLGTPGAPASAPVAAPKNASAAPSPASAAALGIPFEKVVLPENGLEVIFSEDHSLPIVAVNVWYHAGPINEAPKRTGFAHLFEHLMFQGSGHVGDDLHFKLLESRGASLINGTTDFDRTNYFETVPANELELALWLESDRMGYLLASLTQQKLDNQREVVKNERRQSVENVPYGPSEEKLVQTVFAPEHPYYGNVIGSMDDLSAASLDDVKDFYSRYYAPANATVVIAGDFDRSQANALVQRYFASLPRRPKPAPVHVQTAPITQERRVTVMEPVTLPRLSLAYLSPAAFAPGDAEADVLSTVLGGGKSSRFYQRLVYELQLAQQVSVAQQSQALVSTFTVNVVVAPGKDLSKVEAEVNRLLDTARSTAPSEMELTRARNQLRTRMVSSLQSMGGFGGKADTLNRYNQYTGDPGYFARDLERYAQVSASSVQALAKQILNPAARAVVITVPK
jgi:zinc protease